MPIRTARRMATSNAIDIKSEIGPNYTFAVTFSDNVAIDISTLDSTDLRVTGPNGYDRIATFLSVDANSDGTENGNIECDRYQVRNRSELHVRRYVFR